MESARSATAKLAIAATLALFLLAALGVSTASAALPLAPTTAVGSGPAPKPAAPPSHSGGGLCDSLGSVPVAGGVLSAECGAAGTVLGVLGSPGGAAGGIGGAIVGAAAKTVFDDLASWVEKGAASVINLVVKAMQATTTPELTATWFVKSYKSMALLGIGIGLIVAMLGIASAAIRNDGEALAGVLAGMFRAGIGTGVVIALTLIALGIADAVSSDVLQQTLGSGGSTFFTKVATAWGDSGTLGGFGSAIVAMIFAIIAIITSIAIWIELILRNAVIYIAVLFLPVTLAAGIWPALKPWGSRLIKTLAAFVLLKPVIVIILSLAGSAAAAGLSGDTAGPVGVLLASIVIFGLAAFTPYALIAMLGAGSDAHFAASAARGGVSRLSRTGQSFRGRSGGGGGGRSSSGRASGARSSGSAGGGPAAGGGGGGAATAGGAAAGGAAGAGAGAGASAGAGSGAAAGGGAGAAGGAAAAPVGAVLAAAGFGAATAKKGGHAAGERSAGAAPAGGGGGGGGGGGQRPGGQSSGQSRVSSTGPSGGSSGGGGAPPSPGASSAPRPAARPAQRPSSPGGRPPGGGGGSPQPPRTPSPPVKGGPAPGGAK